MLRTTQSIGSRKSLGRGFSPTFGFSPYILAVVVALTVLPQILVGRQRVASEQGSKCPEDSARDMVNQLWDMAASGRLLNREGWEYASRYYFSKPTSWSSDGSIQVVSDDWNVNYDSCSGDMVLGKKLGADEVFVKVVSHWGRKPGLIDAQLRFTLPPPSPAYETATGYHLVLTTLHIYTTPDNPKQWMIQGSPPPPFATVTAAIRYVMEKRAETKDPVVRKNADETLAKLLRLH